MSDRTMCIHGALRPAYTTRTNMQCCWLIQQHIYVYRTRIGVIYNCCRQLFGEGSEPETSTFLTLLQEL
jgi:hypothetical protein